MGRRIALFLLVVAIMASAWAWQADRLRAPGARDTASRQTAAPATSPAATSSPAAPPVATPPVAAPLVPPEAAPPVQASAPSESAPPASSAKPSFDIVRVEPDGSAVIAGRGRPNTTIALRNGDTTLGEARTDANGDFVLDLSLPVGEHRLRLADAGTPGLTASDDAAIVSVPPRGRPGELLVMMQRPGEPSEILVKPQASGPDLAALAPPASSRAVSPPPSDPPIPDETPAIRARTQSATAEPSTATGARLPPAPAAGGLAVEAVEIERGKLFVAGAADPRSTIRIYLDGRLVTETQGGAGDRFIGSALAEVAVGDHVIRADEIGPDGQVIARVEVPFNRPDTSAMSAVASAEPQVPPGGDSGAAVSPDSANLAETTAAGSAATSSSMRTPLRTVEARVIIRRGDSLWRISRGTYGRGSRYSEIYLANGDQIRDPNRIYPGQVFRLPEDKTKAAPKG